MKSELNSSIITRLTQFLYFSILLTPFLPPVALLVVGIATLIFMTMQQERWNLKNWPEVVFAGFIVVSVLSWLVDPSWYNGIPIGVFPVATFGLYLFLAVWIRNVVKWSWQDVQKMYLQFWLGGFYVATIVIIQQADWFPLTKHWLGPLLSFYKYFSWQTGSARSIGTTGNSNLTAALLICLALMSIYAISVMQKKWQKVLAFSSFFVFVFAIWCTGSRGAWVGLVVGLITQLWMTGHRKRTVALTLLIMGLAIFYPQLIPRKETLESTMEVRFFIWKNSFQLFQEHWLLGTLPIHFEQLFKAKTGQAIHHAHNILLGIATEYGIIGFLMFCALLVVTIYRARRWRKSANSKGEKRLAGMLVSQTIALMGHGMYDYPIIAPQVGLMFMLSIIMIHTQYERRCQSRPEWSEPEQREEEPAPNKSAITFVVKKNWRNRVVNRFQAYKKRA